MIFLCNLKLCSSVCFISFLDDRPIIWNQSLFSIISIAIISNSKCGFWSCESKFSYLMYVVNKSLAPFCWLTWTNIQASKLRTYYFFKCLFEQIYCYVILCDFSLIHEKLCGPLKRALSFWGSFIQTHALMSIVIPDIL